ncbi:MAG: hypothetical protein RLZZ628_3757 [Bacteroidota bacterium]|jgi:predicted P-loop ATPase
MNYLIKEEHSTQPNSSAETEVIGSETNFRKRMREIGFEGDEARFSKHPDEPFSNVVKLPLFWEDDAGICIPYLGLDGEIIGYDSSEAKSRINYQPYFRRRLHAPIDDKKYEPCSVGLGVFPYLTPIVVNAYQETTPIKTLIITEGEFKAFAGAKKGLYIIAIPGINIWKPKDCKTAFESITNIIAACRVQDVLFLTDADTLKCNYDESNIEKDLAIRANSFYNAVKMFKELLRDLNTNLYFSHIKTDCEWKGLDDLLIGSGCDAPSICEDLLKHSGERRFFERIDITTMSYTKIKNYFNVANVKQYYEFHKDTLMNSSFVFGRKMYRFSEEVHKLVTIRSLQQSDGEDIFHVEEEDEENSFSIMKSVLMSRFDFRFNKVSLDMEISKKNQNKYQIFEHDDLRSWCLQMGCKGVKENLNAFLGTSRFRDDYNPLAEYFEGLAGWDGETDHIAHLASFVLMTRKERAWFDKMFKKHLVRCVACAFGSHFNKHCLILKSNQHDGKTSFIRFLSPFGEQTYYKENPNFERDEDVLAIVRNFIINLDDMDKIPEKLVAKIKAILSYDYYEYRLPWGSKPAKFKRYANFFGTTNLSDLLTDPTGSVRWLIFNIKGILHDEGGPKGYNRNVDIHKVWAQAYALFLEGFEYNITKKEAQIINQMNEQFSLTTFEEQNLATYIRVPQEQDDVEFLTAWEIFLRFIPTQLQSKTSAIAIGKAMTRLKFERKPMRRNGKIDYGYWVHVMKENAVI